MLGAAYSFVWKYRIEGISVDSPGKTVGSCTDETASGNEGDDKYSYSKVLSFTEFFSPLKESVLEKGLDFIFVRDIIRRTRLHHQD